MDAVGAVARDDVSRGRGGAADGVVVDAAGQAGALRIHIHHAGVFNEADSVSGIGSCQSAGGVGADEVPLNHVSNVIAGKAIDVGGNFDAIGAVGRNHIGRTGLGAADDVVGGAVDVHAVILVAQRGGAIGLEAEVIAADDIVGCAGVAELDAIETIAGDDVSRGWDGAADGSTARLDAVE